MSQGGILQGLQTLQHNALVNQQLKTDNADKNAQKSARAIGLGGYSPDTGITWDTGRQAPSGQSQSLLTPSGGGIDATFIPQAQPQRQATPISTPGLLGPKPDTSGLLTGGPQDVNQAQQQQPQQPQPDMSWVNRADPDTALKNIQIAQQRQSTIAAIDAMDLPPAAKQAMKVDVMGAPNVASAMSDSLKTPEPLKLADALTTAMSKVPKDSPQYNQYQKMLDGLNLPQAQLAETVRHDQASEALQRYDMKIDPFGEEKVWDKKDGKFITDPNQAADTTGKMLDANAAAIANYKQKPPSGLSATRPFAMKTMAKVYELNPDYDANNFDVANKARKDFGTGKQGNLVRSANVATTHLMLLQQLGNALDNGDIQTVNRIKNRLSQEFGGVAISGYEAVAPLVADEVAKFIMGGQTAVADRQEFAKPLTSAKGPAARKAAIDSMSAAMVGQLHGLRQQYKFNTKLNDFGEMLDPEVASLIDNPQYQPGTNPTAAPQQGSADTAPRPANIPAGAPSASDGKGNKIYFYDGKWQ